MVFYRGSEGSSVVFSFPFLFFLFVSFNLSGMNSGAAVVLWNDTFCGADGSPYGFESWPRFEDK